MEKPVRTPTPNLIILICLLGLASVGVAIVTAITTWIPPIDWTNIALAVMAALGLVALVALFRMKRSGLWLYTALAVLIVVLSLFDGNFTWYFTILSAMLIIGGFVYYPQMS